MKEQETGRVGVRQRAKLRSEYTNECEWERRQPIRVAFVQHANAGTYIYDKHIIHGLIKAIALLQLASCKHCFAAAVVVEIQFNFIVLYSFRRFGLHLFPI